MNSLLYERYQRQVVLKGFGEAGQIKLLKATVLVIGAGGLGCPVLQYLAAAGIGHIGIADADTVSLSNLHRQVLFSSNDIGKPKANTAMAVLQQLNNTILLNAYNLRIDTTNALDLIRAYDLVIDCTDNFATRYLINDACILLDKPLIYGAVSEYEGQLAVWNVGYQNGERSASYRDIFPVAPKEDEVLNCSAAGVLGVLPGIIGAMMASEAIKLITGIGQPLINALLTYSSLTSEVYTVQLTPKASTRLLSPANQTAFKAMDYHWLCSPTTHIQQVTSSEFSQLILDNNALIIDVREDGEEPVMHAFAHVKIPLSGIKKNIPALDNNTIVIFCQSGVRSLQAAQLLSNEAGAGKKIMSLKGGIVNWINSNTTTEQT